MNKKSGLLNINDGSELSKKNKGKLHQLKQEIQETQGDPCARQFV